MSYVYAAIGHFKGSENMTCVASTNATKKAFQDDLRGNEFVAYAVLTEWMFGRLMSLKDFELYEQVKKLTSNYRKWNDLTDYIEQCSDIIASTSFRRPEKTSASHKAETPCGASPGTAPPGLMMAGQKSSGSI